MTPISVRIARLALPPLPPPLVAPISRLTVEDSNDAESTVTPRTAREKYEDTEAGVVGVACACAALGCCWCERIDVVRMLLDNAEEDSDDWCREDEDSDD